MSHAKGRDLGTAEILSRSPIQFRIVMPSVCIMEAFSTFEDERRRHNRLIGELERQIGQSRRNVASAGATRLVEHLGRAIDELRDIFDEFQGRLYGAIDLLRVVAELIDPTPEIVGESLAHPWIDDPTDNLILASILNHAGVHPEAKKAFLSENRNDFYLRPYPRAAIDRAGIKYFSSPSNFLEWQRAQPEP